MTVHDAHGPFIGQQRVVEEFLRTTERLVDGGADDDEFARRTDPCRCGRS